MKTKGLLLLRIILRVWNNDENFTYKFICTCAYVCAPDTCSKFDLNELLNREETTIDKIMSNLDKDLKKVFELPFLFKN